MKVYKSSKQESATVSKGNIGAVTEPPNQYFYPTSNLPDQQYSFTNLAQKNTSRRYVLYWNEAYENKGKKYKNMIISFCGESNVLWFNIKYKMK